MNNLKFLIFCFCLFIDKKNKEMNPVQIPHKSIENATTNRKIHKGNADNCWPLTKKSYQQSFVLGPYDSKIKA